MRLKSDQKMHHTETSVWMAEERLLLWEGDVERTNKWPSQRLFCKFCSAEHVELLLANFTSGSFKLTEQKVDGSRER